MAELVSVASDPLSGIALAAAGDDSDVEFHKVDRAAGIATHFHGGRAHANNAALLSVLQMAAATTTATEC